jgi:hypothetical protein
MNDPWTGIIAQMVPGYEDLKHMAENGPRITAVLRKINLSTRVRIEEDWGETDTTQQYLYLTADCGKLDSRCEWAAEQLQNWKFVNRLSHQEWKFLCRKDAEKFKTLFLLKWPN